MGLSTAINFRPTVGGRAAINGDFVMTSGDIDRVISALRQNGIQVVALHNHLTDEEPRLFFMHLWAGDDAVTLAWTPRRTGPDELTAGRIALTSPRPAMRAEPRPGGGAEGTPAFVLQGVLRGRPWIEHLRGNWALTAVLSGITAAVVGVVLNLSAWFSYTFSLRKSVGSSTSGRGSSCLSGKASMWRPC